MAGSPQAYSYRVSPRRSEAELIVKGNHTIDIYVRYTEKFGNLPHGLPGKKAKSALNSLQYRDKILPFPAELFQDLSGFLPNFNLFLSHINTFYHYVCELI